MRTKAKPNWTSVISSRKLYNFFVNTRDSFLFSNQSQKMHSFVPHAKMNGKFGFHAWFHYDLLIFKRVVIFLGMDIPYKVKM